MRNRKKKGHGVLYCLLIVILSALGTNFFSFKISGITFGNERIGFIIILLIEIGYSIIHADLSFPIRKGSSKYIKFHFIWLVYAIANVAFVKDFDNYIKNIEMLVQALVYCLIFSRHLSSYDDIIATIKGFVFVGVIHNVIGWYEFFTGKYTFVVEDRAWMFRRFSRPVSSYGNCNDFATLLFLIVFISFYLFQYSRANKKGKLTSFFYLSVSISSLLLVIFTGSRGNLLAFVPSLFVGLYMYMKDHKTKQQLLYFVFGFVALVPIIILLMERYSLYDRIFTVFTSSGAAQSNAGRMDIYKNGILFLLDSYFIGIGAGSADYWLTYRPHFPVGVHKLHSWFLEILACYGIIIFIYYAYCYLCLIKDSRRIVKARAYSKDGGYYIESLFTVFFAGYVISSMSSGSNFAYSWIWVLFALAITTKGISKTQVG